MFEIEKQTVWVNTSPIRVSSGGYVYWEIREVIGDPGNFDGVMETLDGKYIYVSADLLFNGTYMPYESHYEHVIDINEV